MPSHSEDASPQEAAMGGVGGTVVRGVPILKAKGRYLDPLHACSLGISFSLSSAVSFNFLKFFPALFSIPAVKNSFNFHDLPVIGSKNIFWA
jgi:hypothetical protein